jgi:hypothetical protein
MTDDWKISITSLAIRAHGVALITSVLLILPGAEGFFSPHSGLGVLLLVAMFPVALVVFAYAYFSTAAMTTKKRVLRNILILLLVYFPLTFGLAHLVAWRADGDPQIIWGWYTFPLSLFLPVGRGI